MVDIKQRFKKAIFVFTVLLYFSALIYIVMFKNDGNAVRTVRWQPFNIALRYFSGELTLLNTLKNVLGNFFLFMPIGLVLPLISDKFSFVKCLIVGFILSLLAETLQYVFCLGVSDVDDIMTNTFGVFVGACIYWLILRKMKYRKSIIIIFMLLFILVGFVSVWYYQPDLIFGKMTYYGDSISGINMDSYDVSVECYKISYGGLFLKTGTVTVNNSDFSGNVEDVCYFTNDTVYVISDNGGYRVLKREEFKQAIEEVKDAKVCIWFDRDGKCKMVLYNKL